MAEHNRRPPARDEIKDYITRLILFVIPASFSITPKTDQGFPQPLVNLLAWCIAALPAPLLRTIRSGANIAIQGSWNTAQILIVLAIIWFGIGAVNHATDDMDRLYIAARMCEDREDLTNSDVCRLILDHEGKQSDPAEASQATLEFASQWAESSSSGQKGGVLGVDSDALAR